MPVHPVTRSHLMPAHRYRQWNIQRGRSGSLDFVYLLFFDTLYTTAVEEVIADAMLPEGPTTADGKTLHARLMADEEAKEVLKELKATSTSTWHS